jgi:NTP pyrophosphatase (non-canonical NTP hydrolase)
MQKDLGIREFSALNVARCEEVFHPLDDWSVSDWIMAITGELGELANELKKVHRGDVTFEERRGAIEREFADVLAYLTLLASRCRVDLAKAVVTKFNEVSAKKDATIFLDELEAS